MVELGLRNLESSLFAREELFVEGEIVVALDAVTEQKSA